MRNLVGPPVRQDDFLERPDDVRQLWDCVTRGHVVMLGPSRVGKTSVLFRMVDAPAEGWTCRYLNVEPEDTEARFVARLLKEIRKAQPRGAWLKTLISQMKAVLSLLQKLHLGPFGAEFGEASKDDWQDKDSVLNLMAGIPQNTLILIDEFPQFVGNLLHRDRGAAERFLSWFHTLRSPPGGDKFQVIFLLTGSISLDSVVQAEGLTKIYTDLQNFRLGPISKDSARELLWRLSRGEGLPLSGDVIEAIVERLDWLVPYHLQLLFKEILVSARFKKGPVDIAMVEIAYRALLEAKNMMYFNHWVERLEKTFTPRECALVKALLSEAARNPSGLSQAAVDQICLEIPPDTHTPSNILARLVHDGYLTEHESEGRWRFTSTLLRDWWRKWQA